MLDKKPDFLIGIDLGTTNTVLAYADMRQALGPENCQIFEIEQLVAPGEVAKRPQLPSFRYHPSKGELSETDLTLPWSDKLPNELPQVIIGEWARELGAKVEGRQVVSAKSWLSHPHVDRSAAILPWGSNAGSSATDTGQSIARVSPVLASASYLFHIKQAWNIEHPKALLEHQEVIITIPASFDEGARSLTVEAAKLAGLDNILLLEEPQAVCYDWYAKQGDQAQAQLAKIKLLLVCDVGGGTTDLSLIKIAQAKDSSLTLTRVGVGNHLMLGGDNVDLALAHIVEKNISNPSSASSTGGADKKIKAIKKLSAASLSQLIQQTRKAKERLLAEDAPDSTKVTLLGSGSKLIGGAKSYHLSKQEARVLALDGFFPLCDIDQAPVKRRSAVVEFGLPYAADPAVSKYIAQFILEHQNVCREALNENTLAIPDALLLNGGVFNSFTLKERAQAVLRHWNKHDITFLENNTPNLAVAQGAVAYAKARRGAQLKIGGGSARHFFLGLDKSEAGQKAICLMPKGTEEDLELMLSERQFSLRLGRPVTFHLFSSTADDDHRAGDLITITEEDIAELNIIALPPLVVALDSGSLSTAADAEQQEVEVILATTLTEVGTLQIDCVSANDAQADALNNNQRWHVEFEIRKSTIHSSTLSHHLGSDNLASSEVELPPALKEVQELIAATFNSAKKDANPKAIKTLRIDIEKRIGKRDSWEAPVLRALFEHLLNTKKYRTRSAAHERIWFNLAGFGLRPGFGYPADEWRIEQVWKLHQQGLTFEKDTQAWIDWWTFWRRAAGGLSALQQQSLYKDIARFLNPSALTSRKLQAEAKQKSYEDMVKLVATLEHLPVSDKTAIAQWLLKRLEKNTETQTSWWALGRIASRSPFHGSAHNVIPKETVQTWFPRLLEIDWKKNQQSAFATVLMSRMSGDRSRDIDDEWRMKICDKLKQSKSPESWIGMIETVKELNESETKRVFGEGLPSGLKLIK
jgi:hypothetical protein